MEELLKHIFSVWGFLILMVVGGSIVAAWQAIRSAEIKARVKEAELALKQDMIARGMSADEIERVLGASSDGASMRRKQSKVTEHASQPQ
jgi:uncharacterized membrane protein